MKRKEITEEMKIHEEWYKEAKSKGMSFETLPEFLKKLCENYTHDYGTICHALTAGAIATMWAMNKTDQGGITGFQASCIMWELIKNWMSYEGPMKLLQYDEMLYPQNEEKFKTSISPETWERIKEKAREGLANPQCGSPKVREHWQSILRGVIPFGYCLKMKE
ncbi:MAG: hypothetical protein ABIA77_04245 [Candidatus Omnitrophota bacterium]|uniref:Uncharacterized protein n=1 Tax=viral metagenome TaxID=1070528 RepID=A0A6M3LC02_9ZZZZ